MVQPKPHYPFILREKKGFVKHLLQGAKLPLPGLSVEDGELTYQGKPWDCMSGSDQLKVSTAIVRALKGMSTWRRSLAVC